MEIVEFLANVKLFQSLSKEGLSQLAASLESVTFPPGEVIKKGDPGDALYIIKSGMANVCKSSSSEGYEACLAMLREGDCFGEVALLDGGPRTASVIAIGPMECYKLSREDFHNTLNANPAIAMDMLPGLAKMVRNADDWITSLFDMAGRIGSY